MFNVIVKLGRLFAGVRLFRPLVNIGKRYLYNGYLKKQLTETDFPPAIWIENTNICNARCIMCPRESHTRKLGTMHMALFEKLMNEIAEHKDKVARVHLHNYGEPLLDHQLPDKIQLAKKSGVKHTYIVTNGSLLTPALSKQLIEAGLDEMKVSFYGTDPETYNQTMRGLDFNKTIQNLNNFFSIRNELGRHNPVMMIQYLPQDSNKALVDEFYRIMRPLIDEKIGDSLNVFKLHTYGGGMSTNDPATDPLLTCPYPWRTMVILHDGKVVLCCVDYNGVQVVGDSNTQSIKEIWNGETYRAIRQNFKRLDYGSYPICMKCDLTR